MTIELDGIDWEIVEQLNGILKERKMGKFEDYFTFIGESYHKLPYDEEGMFYDVTGNFDDVCFTNDLVVYKGYYTKLSYRIFFRVDGKTFNIYIEPEKFFTIRISK